MHRFRDLIGSMDTLVDKARFRGILHSLSALPLSSVPYCRSREFENTEFQWHVANRLKTTQPSVKSLGTLKCTCGADLKGGRHFHRCRIQAGIIKVHGAVRGTMHSMLRIAGLLVRKEPKF